MKQTTKQFLGIAAASVLVIGLVNGVFAHGGYGPGFGPGWGGHHGMMGGPGGMYGPGAGPGWMMDGDPVAYADQQLIGLRSTLGITADQESAWNAYTEAVKGKAGLMASHRQSMFGSGSIAPEQRFTFHQQGLEQMQKVTTASRDLYSVLTPEQQARAGNLIGLHHALR
ncbi:Spy/CpxP family protein refolding chaperone [endosymbiont of Ridgeia piscesae]|jgi:Spy/CpxP family protein refolding chaperone|uniref:LTXXQ motif family protein n=1 Tax=endosymbiont of Ridgeia piscesae TaxID=54398 RepID=A0A0T5Z9R2_9GAMM|nr:Spy/CpxP family protein refolding chaperone [endosymbiont of Ridgeia piscesae]KRT54379.1 LTXXQ motif family protein [endosymbiont of Ridgeia piscesae]KRT59597.1 LTXXQ motif family protein [endosymbiont of Ridgeia piscesae]